MAYSASGSASTSQGVQQRFDGQFGAINNSAGFQIPPAAFIVALILGFAGVIAFLVWLTQKKSS